MTAYSVFWNVPAAHNYSPGEAAKEELNLFSKPVLFQFSFRLIMWRSLLLTLRNEVTVSLPAISIFSEEQKDTEMTSPIHPLFI